MQYIGLLIDPEGTVEDAFLIWIASKALNGAKTGAILASLVAVSTGQAKSIERTCVREEVFPHAQHAQPFCELIQAA